MYDLNMKEIPFPDGVMPLDIFVGSIAKERATETIEGRKIGRASCRERV